MYKILDLAGHDMDIANRELAVEVAAGWVPITLHWAETSPESIMDPRPRVFVLCKQAVPVYGNPDTAEGGPSHPAVVNSP